MPAIVNVPPDPVSQPRIIPARNLPVSQPETISAVVDIQTQNNSSFFTVQLKAATKPLEINSRNFPGLENVFVKKIGIFYKYYTGTYNNLNEASTQRNLLNSQFPGCFVVAFKDGEVVTVNEL